MLLDEMALDKDQVIKAIKINQKDVIAGKYCTCDDYCGCEDKSTGCSCECESV